MGVILQALLLDIPESLETSRLRVAEKSDFTLEGILRQSRRGADGELADSCMYARLS